MTTEYAQPVLLQFLIAVFLLFITPGPGVLSLAGVGAAFGKHSGLRYMLGLFIGTNLVALAVVTGVAAIMLSIPVLRTVLFVISIAYLLWLAVRIALSGSNIGFIAAHREPGVRDGIVLQAFNPKAYVVNTALFTGFPFASGNLLLETVIKFIIVNAFWIAVHLLWLAAGVKVQTLSLSAGAQRGINIVMSCAMVGVVVLAALSS